MFDFHRILPLTSAAALAGALFLARPASCQDRYCGVYCAYTVLNHYGQTLDFKDLLEPQYVSGFRGSTAEAVVAALNEHDVTADSFAGLGVFDLRVASGPVILHVRGSQATRRYEHWVVYLGERDGQAVVLDPSRGRTTMKYSRLLAMWDGVGVATSDSAMGLNVWRALALAERWLLLVVLGCLAFPLVRVVERSLARNLRPPWAGSAATPAVLMIVLCAAALGLDLLSANGLLRGAVARASITSVHAHEPVPELELDEAQRSHAAGSAVWIDARYRRDYRRGHIPGALSLPVDATFAEQDEVVSRLPPDAEIVVYCQSEGCPFAHAVSKRLRGHGLARITLFAGGYAEWMASGGPTEPEPTVARERRESDAPRTGTADSGSAG